MDTNIQNVSATEAFGKLRENRVIRLHPVRVGEITGKELPVHGGVGIAPLDVLNAAKQARGIVFQQVGGDDHHAIEAVQYLHQAVTVLVDAGGTELAGG